MPEPAKNRTVRYAEFRVLIRTFLFRCGVLSLAAVAVVAGPPTPVDPPASWQALMTNGINAVTAKDYPKAEEQLQQALQMTGQFPAGDGRIATNLNTLGLVYREERKYPEAEKVFGKALTIFETG